MLAGLFSIRLGLALAYVLVHVINQLALDAGSPLREYFRWMAEFHADPDNNRLFRALARAIQELKKLE